MKSLSQSEYGELRSLYSQMYASNDEILVDDISEEVVEEIFNELVEEYISEGYETEEVLDVVEEAALDFIEAKVTYGHDTEAPEKKSMLKGRIRYAKRKAGEAVKAGKEKVKTAAAVGGVAASIAKDEVRRAGRKAQHSVSKAADAARRAPGEAKKKAKSGIKGFIKRQAQKVVSRMSEEAVGEGIDFKGAAREQARRDAIQAEKDKKSPSSKDRRLAKGKFRPGASAAERAEGGRDAMREKGTSPTKDGKKMFEELQATGLFTEKEIDAILEASENIDEAITSEKGKAKMKAMLDARTTASGRAKPGQGANVATIKHIGRSNRDGLLGTPPNRKVAGRNWPKSYTGSGGTGNKARRRAGTYED